MLKQLFNIRKEETGSAAEKVLSIRTGERHCSFAITDKTGNTLYQLGYYSLDGSEENPVAELFRLHPELQSDFHEVLAAYDYPQSTLVPASHYKQSEAAVVLKTLYGINGAGIVISDSIPSWELYNVYGVPKSIHEWMKGHFHSGHYWHQYTLALKHIGDSSTGSELRVDLRADDFTVVATNEGKLLIAQTFPYSTPSDVLYYLLKTCQQFNLSQQDVSVSLSGLIDRQSALYKELYQYFINLKFREPAWDIPESDYPAHFFTSLNDLAKCAS